MKSRRVRKIDLRKPVVWDFIEKVRVPDGMPMAREGLLSQLRLRPFRPKFLDGGESSTPDTKPAMMYMRSIIEAAKKEWERSEDPLVVLQLLDTFPFFLVPRLPPDLAGSWAWILAALLKVFAGRNYSLFREIESAVFGRGATKGDENVETFEKYHHARRVILQLRLAGWYLEKYGRRLDMATYLELITEKSYPKKLERGIHTEAIGIACNKGSRDEITEDTFKIRLRRARKEPYVQAVYGYMLKGKGGPKGR